MKLSDGLTKRERKRNKQSGEHVHGKRVNRVEYNTEVGLLKDHMDNTHGIPGDYGIVGKVNKRVAKERGTF